MSKTAETVPKIFLEPREKRPEDAKPLNLSKKPVVETLKRASGAANSSSSSSKKDEKPRCMARVATGNQCGRNQKEDYEYCGCHVKHRPYGRFDGPVEGKKFLSVPKKRGPRFKNAKEYTLDELDTDLYVQTQLIRIDGEYYLRDKYGVLYTNDTKCEIVGRTEKEEILWFV